MGNRADPSDSSAARLIIIGLGPGGLNRIIPAHLRLLQDPGRRVIVRTTSHPAAAELSAQRPVDSCDDLYRQGENFDQIYQRIAHRVVASAGKEPTVYAVPGSPYFGEFAVGLIRDRAAAEGIDIMVLPGESFVDVMLAAVSYDPLDRGLQILNGHHLPQPLTIGVPTIVAHLDVPVVLADVAAGLSRVVPEETEVTLLVDGGLDSQRLITAGLGAIDPNLAGMRTSMFIDSPPGGLLGIVQTMQRLRNECPWDRSQTHQSLIKNLIEETFELVEAISRLPEHGEPDWERYAEVEDELGDVLLQVLFHAVIASETGGFNIDDVAESLRQKLVRRHPHVFGDVEVGSADEVKINWDRIKEEERGEVARSALDGVPASLPALNRAASLQRKAAVVGFDWPEVRSVLSKVEEELDELVAVIDDRSAAGDELGDLLFSVVNLSRHLQVDPELVLRRSIDKFVGRFRTMEEMGPLDGLSLDELDARWEAAKE